MIHNYNTNPTSINKITMACAGGLNKTTKEYPHIRMDRFHYFEKRSFCFKNNEEKLKNETVVFKNNQFLKDCIFF